MADNVNIPATGSGDAGPIPVATDEVGSAHYQRMKLDGGGDGVSVPIVAGQQVAAESIPVVLPAAQISTLTPPAAISGFLTEADFDTKVGALTETAPATDTASSGVNGRLQRLAQRISSLITALTDGSARVGGTVAVSAASLPLPTSAATEATLGTRLSESDFDAKAGSLTETAPATDTASSGLNGRLQRIAQRLSSLIALLPASLGGNGGLKIEGVSGGQAVPVSAASLPLPSGAATSANQQTDALTDTQLRATAVPVSMSAVPTGASTAANQATEIASLASIDTKTPALGQAVAGASVPVVLPAAQITTLTPPAAITGFLTEADFDTKTGSLTETAPATDIASSGLNGRLQRIAQRLSSLITALGSPFQAGGSIGNTSFASTVADGANVTLGAKADAKSTATDTTAVTAMSVWKQISASVQSLVTNLGTVVFGAGTAAAAQRTTLASDDPAVATLGAVADAAVSTDTTGSISAKLRGLIKLATTAGSFLVTVQSKTIYTRPVYGTPQTVFNSAVDIGAGAFSAAGTAFTNNDATIGAAPYADVMIEMPDWAAAPVAGTVVQLWGLLIDVDGTDDDTDAPSAAASGGARLLCSFVIAAADALQRRTMTISLAGIQNGFTPYIFNGTAQNMNNDGGTAMVVKITPWTNAQVG